MGRASSGRYVAIDSFIDYYCFPPTTYSLDQCYDRGVSFGALFFIGSGGHSRE